MADSLLYNVLESIRTTIRDQFATEATRLSLTTATAPASADHKIIASDYMRSRTTKYPFCAVIPVPEGRDIEQEYTGTDSMSEWLMPVRVELVDRDRKGVELTNIKMALEYAAILDAILINNQGFGRTDALAVNPQRMAALYLGADGGKGGSLWGAYADLTIRIHPDNG